MKPASLSRLATETDLEKVNTPFGSAFVLIRNQCCQMQGNFPVLGKFCLLQGNKEKIENMSKYREIFEKMAGNLQGNIRKSIIPAFVARVATIKEIIDYFSNTV